MRVNVTNASGTECSANLNNGTIPPVNTIPCPTGNASLTDNGSPLNDFTVSNTGVTSNVVPLNRQGFLEDHPIQLPAGNHSIVAAYAGDNSYISSSSAADAISITKASTTVSMNPTPNASTNSPIALSATVNTGSSGVGPTGTMTFSSAGTILGTAPVVGTAANLTPTPFTPASGTATFNATFTTTGAKNVTASYSGDSNYSSSGPSTAVSVNVISSGSFNITATPVTVTAGSSNVSTITVTPSGGFTGNVQVTCAGTGLRPGAPWPPHPLTITVTGTAPVTGALTVLVAAPSATLSASRFSPEHHPFYAVAKVRPPTNSKGRLSAWWTVTTGSGLSSILLVLFPALLGRKQLRAALGLALLCVLSFTLGCGGGGSGGGGGGTTHVATRTTLIVTTAKQASTNNNFAFTVAVTSSGAAPTGQVQLFDGSTALGLPVSMSSGAAAINTGLPTIGTHAVSAHYLGDTATLPSASGALNLTVTGTTSLPLAAAPSGSGSINLTIQ